MTTAKAAQCVVQINVALYNVAPFNLTVYKYCFSLVENGGGVKNAAGAEKKLSAGNVKFHFNSSSYTQTFRKTKALLNGIVPWASFLFR